MRGNQRSETHGFTVIFPGVINAPSRSPERASAIRVAYVGIRDGFLSILADDAVICGEGLIPGRAFYEAIPKEQPGHLMWEPTLALASSDGTLVVTSGPYRLMDGAGLEKSSGPALYEMAVAGLGIARLAS
jgi:hypothetical protein